MMIRIPADHDSCQGTPQAEDDSYQGTPSGAPQKPANQWGFNR
jgi:hypothetical protein